MRLSSIARSIFRAAEEFDIIDAHEHLFPEKGRLNQKPDVFSLFSHYSKVDAMTAGMPLEHWNKIPYSKNPLEERWKIFSPYLKYIRYGSYSRPALIAAKEFYGVDDINENSYRILS